MLLAFSRFSIIIKDLPDNFQSPRKIIAGDTALFLDVLDKYTSKIEFNNDLQVKTIHSEHKKMNYELFNDPEIKWVFLKYQIRKFTIRFSKIHAKEEGKKRKN